MKHLFIVNPRSGGKSHDPQMTKRAIDRVMDKRADDYEVYFTKMPMDACRKINEEKQSCDDLRVYACGGDGTLNECVNGAAESENVAVTQFPCGTGNDFLRIFGEESKLFNDIDRLLDGEIHKIDTIKCNDRYGVNICSVGIDARVGTDVHEYTKFPLNIRGPFSYVVSLAVNVFKGITSQMRVKYDGVDYDGKVTLLCACNGRYYGGGFNPVPDAVLDDGIMDVLLVKTVPGPLFVPLLLKYATGRYKEVAKYAAHSELQRLEISADETFVVNVDGEALYTDKVIFELIPKSLNLITPANMIFWNKNEETKRKRELERVNAGN